MSRRAWTGVVAGVFAALLVLGVAGTAYRIGEHHEVVTRTVGDGPAGDGTVVRVVGDGWGYGHGWGYGGGFCFFLFPLLILGLFLLFRGRRGYWGGGYGGGGYGRCGPGHAFEEEHKRAHERASSGPPETAEA